MAEDDDPDAAGEEGDPDGDGERRAGPLSDLADEVDERRNRAESDDLFEGAFEDVGVDEDDADAVWDGFGSEGLGAGVEGAAVEAEADEETYLLEKREYCQRCQFFSAPPQVECTYEGSAILEMDDTEHFRVRGCPIVEGREDLQSLEK